MLGHHRHADVGPLIVVFESSLPSSTKQKNVKIGPPLTKLSGSEHDVLGDTCACMFRDLIFLSNLTLTIDSYKLIQLNVLLLFGDFDWSMAKAIPVLHFDKTPRVRIFVDSFGFEVDDF